MINDWTRDTHLGIHPDAQSVVALEDDRGRLVGIGSFQSKPAPGERPVPEWVRQRLAPSQYVHALAIDRLYQGQRLRDGSRPADLLLAGTLELIAAANDGRMPLVWSLVSYENERAQALFERHGFQAYPYVGEGDFIYSRQPRSSRLASGGLKISRWLERRAGNA